MVNYCPNCGWRVLDPETTVCGGCGESLPGRERAGLLARLIGWLSAARSTRRESFGRRKQIRMSCDTKFSWIDPITGRQQTATRLDELPPEIRERFEELRRKAIQDGPPSSGSRYTVRDSSGREQTYHSLEEMPPEIRRLFERAQES